MPSSSADLLPDPGTATLSGLRFLLRDAREDCGSGQQQGPRPAPSRLAAAVSASGRGAAHRVRSGSETAVRRLINSTTFALGSGGWPSKTQLQADWCLAPSATAFRGSSFDGADRRPCLSYGCRVSCCAGLDTLRAGCHGPTSLPPNLQRKWGQQPPHGCVRVPGGVSRWGLGFYADEWTGPEVTAPKMGWGWGGGRVVPREQHRGPRVVSRAGTRLQATESLTGRVQHLPEGRGRELSAAGVTGWGGPRSRNLAVSAAAHQSG